MLIGNVFNTTWLEAVDQRSMNIIERLLTRFGSFNVILVAAAVIALIIVQSRMKQNSLLRQYAENFGWRLLESDDVISREEWADICANAAALRWRRNFIAGH